MKPAHSVAAMRKLARRRLPRLVFDFVDGGAGRESALTRSELAFDAVRLLPRVLAGAEVRSQTIELLGRSYAAPFGIAPIGMANLVAPGVDMALARAAADAAIPYCLSTAATTAIEEIARAAPASWFQLYVGREQAIVEDLIRRADTAGAPVLMVTADVPAPGKRLRDLDNGFMLPLEPSLRLAADLFTHPRWALATALGGAPRFANLERYEQPGASAQSLARLMASQSSARLDWELLARIRDRWQRRLILKGVLHPDDARRAQRIGADAIVVSNHGGRQLDCAPAPLEVLPQIAAAVGGRCRILLDGGVRTGEDVARALALGADAVLLGRPFLFAVAALGPDGARALIAMLQDEIDRVLAHLGCCSPAELDQSFVWREPPDAAVPDQPAELESGAARPCRATDAGAQETAARCG